MDLRDLILKDDFNVAALLWGVAEAVTFFIVPDVLLSYVGLRRGPRAAGIASLFAAFGAACGGAFMFWWSAHDPEAARHTVLAVPAISEAMVVHAEQAMAGNWFVATLFGPLSSTPFKVYAILAPHAGASMGAFVLAGFAARLPRFLIISIGVAFIGRGLSRWLDAGQLRWVLFGAWLLFYAVFFALMPN